ncbi:MAG: gamma-butyrobetaine dioxygenase [Gaiellaceae bacterium]|jgi:gamma-butyrobetaine dioxygenase|nr:gamma-butyrobetaine dioxygenase [Gaiellaceae bacterium]
MSTVRSLSPDGPLLHLDWSDGHHSSFHAVWLRDNCACPECRHENGQRLLDTRRIPDEPALAAARLSNGSVEATFEDGHEARWDAAWLRANCYCEDEPAPSTSRRLWDASIQSALPAWSYDDVAAGGESLRAWLAAVDALGFGILTGGPTDPDTVIRVAELFGFVRETNYGRLFDVRSVVNPTNLAYTGLGLGAHTDNPYREPTPTLQLLHCLSSSAGGGENTLVDSFRVAEDLPRDQFELLARQPIRFRFADDDAELETETTVLSLDARGALQAVHYNTRSAQVFRLAPPLVEPYYAAYQAFGRMLEDELYRIQFKLAPGDLFIVDNLRVLHGRTAYAPEGGERHLQGCYADRDGLRSKLAVLSR